MAVTPSEILSLTNEAAVFVQRGRISYANASACKALGEEPVGRTVHEIFGKEISQMQAGGFISGLQLHGRNYIVRVSPVGNGQVFFLSPHSVETQLINDTVLSLLKNNIAVFNFADEWAMEIADELGSKALSRYLCSMNHSMFRILRLIKNITVVRDSNAGELLYSPSTFDLCELCRNIVDSIGVLKKDEDVRFEHEGRVLIYADALLTEQMILNLISNCIIHAKGHTVISISIIESAGSVVLSVSDDGCGMDSEQLAKVFERYRFDFNISEMGAGAGFGLNAALCIAEQHGGTLVLESRVDRGTTVRASIRRVKDSSLAAPSEKYEANARSFLAGLASCLPDECFSSRFLE